MIERPRFFFGWHLVWLTVLSMTLVYGARMSFSILFGPILDELQQPRGSTAVMLSLNILVYGLTAPVAGALADRWKPRKVAFIGIIILAAATGLCYFSTQLWHFYLFFGVIAPIGTAFCGTPVLNPSLINWFGKRRGLAIGLGQIGGGLSFAYGLIVELVISHWGWRPSFLVMSGTILAVLLPLYFFFYFYRPREKGLEAYGISGESNPAAGGKIFVPPVKDWTLRSASKTYQLWFMVLAQFCFWGIGNYLVVAHQVKYAEDAGYGSILATSVYALFGIISIGGQLAASISDYIGREKTATIGVFCAVAGMAALISVRDASQPWLLYSYAIGCGFATGLFSPQVYAGLGDIFYGKSVGVISALLLTGTGLGGAIGPWLGGYIYDVSGSYTTAFFISTGGYILAGIFYWIAGPRNAEKLRAQMLSG